MQFLTRLLKGSAQTNFPFLVRKLGRKREKDYKLGRVQQMEMGTPILPALRFPTQPSLFFPYSSAGAQSVSSQSSLSLWDSLSDSGSFLGQPCFCFLLPSLASLFIGSISYLMPCRMLMRTQAFPDLADPNDGTFPDTCPSGPPFPRHGGWAWYLHDTRPWAPTARFKITCHEFTSDFLWGVGEAAVSRTVEACCERKGHLNLYCLFLRKTRSFPLFPQGTGRGRRAGLEKDVFLLCQHLLVSPCFTLPRVELCVWGQPGRATTGLGPFLPEEEGSDACRRHQRTPSPPGEWTWDNEVEERSSMEERPMAHLDLPWRPASPSGPSSSSPAL